MKRVKRLFYWASITALALLLAVLGWLIYLAKDLPSPTVLSKQELARSTRIYDRSGQTLLFDLHGEERRVPIALADIPAQVISTTLSAEDKDFYSHYGIDLRGILRAAVANLRGGRVSQGGSTITQQLIKNSLLTKERTWTRKVKEIILALELEVRYSKDEILEMYFNQIPYGSNAYGIESAANTYFNKSAKDLTLAEAAALASLIKAPSYYSPFGPNRKELLARQQTILQRTYDSGYINEEELKAAQSQKLTFAKQRAPIKAPHFVFYVQEYLNEKYGEEIVNRAGWKVVTSLDWELQQAAEKLVAEGAARNEQLWGARNAALVSIDPTTGQVLAMVGSRDYFNERVDGNVNVTLRPRSPGSAFKPFAYATAFAKGYPDTTVVFDVPTEYNPLCSPDSLPPPQYFAVENFCYRPGNYDGKFVGAITLREALAQSRNVPSVQALYLAGLEDTIKTAEKMGVTSLKDRSRFGLSIVLGGAEVKPLEMARAYGVFAQQGILRQTAPILEITDPDGKVIEKFQDSQKRVLDSNIALMISDVLSDNAARAPQFGPRSDLFFEERQVAAKTGTSQDYRDAWVVGYTPSVSTAVWVGNNDNTAMAQGGAGIAAAGPIFHKFMEEVFKKIPPETIPKPTWPQTDKPILKGAAAAPDYHTTLYYLNRDDPNGPSPTNPAQDPQFANWESAVRNWYGAQQLAPQVPSDRLPKIFFTNPQPDSQVTSDFLPAAAVVTGFYPIVQVDFFLDNAPIGSVQFPPYQLFYKIPASFNNGSHLLRARAYDQSGLSSEAGLTIILNRAR